jgi:RNA-directed DNA polymerase
MKAVENRSKIWEDNPEKLWVNMVRSERAGKRFLDSIERFLDKTLKLKVNRQKSAVTKPQERKFLGFSFTSGRELKIKLSDKALNSVKYQIKKITRRSRGISLLQIIKELSTYLRGWLGYYRLIETPTALRDLDSWVMKQWINNCHTRYKGLRALGVSDRNARPVAASRKGPWVMSNMKSVKVAMPNRFFAERGILSLFNHYESLAKTI